MALMVTVAGIVDAYRAGTVTAGEAYGALAREGLLPEAILAPLVRLAELDEARHPLARLAELAEARQPLPLNAPNETRIFSLRGHEIDCNTTSQFKNWICINGFCYELDFIPNLNPCILRVLQHSGPFLEAGIFDADNQDHH